MTVLDFRAAKREGRRLALTTCYDHALARIIADTEVDAILVGDSVAMVVHGLPTTLGATMEMMELHTAAVARGAPDTMVIGDMPFLSFRRGIAHAMDCVERLLRAGARAVKVEGISGHEDVIRHIVESGVPVMGHLGLVPQSVNALGGHRVQAREPVQASRMLDDARRLEDAGCFSVVLECVGVEGARAVTEALAVPTIGIGAGPHVDGQILVLHDLLGLDPAFHPKFVRRFGDAHAFVHDALARYVAAVRDGGFPGEQESYG